MAPGGSRVILGHNVKDIGVKNLRFEWEIRLTPQQKEKFRYFVLHDAALHDYVQQKNYHNGILREEKYKKVTNPSNFFKDFDVADSYSFLGMEGLDGEFNSSGKSIKPVVDLKIQAKIGSMWNQSLDKLNQLRDDAASKHGDPIMSEVEIDSQEQDGGRLNSAAQSSKKQQEVPAKPAAQLEAPRKAPLQTTATVYSVAQATQALSSNRAATTPARARHDAPISGQSGNTSRGPTRASPRYADRIPSISAIQPPTPGKSSGMALSHPITKATTTTAATATASMPVVVSSSPGANPIAVRASVPQENNKDKSKDKLAQNPQDLMLLLEASRVRVDQGEAEVLLSRSVVDRETERLLGLLTRVWIGEGKGSDR